MNITTLENGDRSLELSEHERDILVQVVTYLRDNYDDLEFSIRNFTFEEASQALHIFERFHEKRINALTENEAELLETILCETGNLIDGVLLDENTDLEIVSRNLFRMLFENLGTSKYLEKITS